MTTTADLNALARRLRNYQKATEELARNDSGNDPTIMVLHAQMFGHVAAVIESLTTAATPPSEPPYKCYSCKQVFEEDHGHGLARQHFGEHLNGDLPKCVAILNSDGRIGGGAHDPYVRVRKDHYNELLDARDGLSTTPPTEPTVGISYGGSSTILGDRAPVDGLTIPPAMPSRDPRPPTWVCVADPNQHCAFHPNCYCGESPRAATPSAEQSTFRERACYALNLDPEKTDDDEAIDKICSLVFHAKPSAGPVTDEVRNEIANTLLLPWSVDNAEAIKIKDRNGDTLATMNFIHLRGKRPVDQVAMFAENIVHWINKSNGNVQPSADNIINAVIERAEQACRFVLKYQRFEEGEETYREAYEAACSLCEKAIAPLVKEHIAADLFLLSPPRAEASAPDREGER